MEQLAMETVAPGAKVACNGSATEAAWLLVGWLFVGWLCVRLLLVGLLLVRWLLVR